MTGPRLFDAVDEAAERAPDHEAVRRSGEALTYAALSERSDRLAGALADHGVRRGDRVALFLDKGLEATTALYGIMKAGAAYVSLDASAPPARLAFILNDCDIRIVISAPGRGKALAAILAEGTGVEAVVGVGEALEGPRAVSWAEVEAASRLTGADVTADDLCYLFYTSGSTGEPKGVAHTHASGLAYAAFTADVHGFRAEDRVGGYTHLHFDPSTVDYFAAAVAGATTVVIPEAHMRLPASLSGLLETERLTVFCAVPFAYTQLVQRGALDKRDLGALRWALFSGEVMPPDTLRLLMRAWPKARFCNIYGPTELNGITYHVVPEGYDGAEAVPIGRPYPGVEAIIVDDDGRAVGGGPGELLVQSPTRMAAYWGRPEATASAFVERDGGTYYRTGDLVARQPDGELLFLGRKDRQIKTRGHRVELAEVEAALTSHEAVESAAAFADPDGSGSHRILAALASRGGLDLDALRQHVLDRLPPYAVPEAMTALDPFPRTATGKIDRQRAEVLARARLGADRPVGDTQDAA